ncbi:putative ABC transport system permease protein [Bradyrhizobium algeriense]|uniref:ABC transport system permease protein n=1 Tax=Bradyrhizobium algeriense TaxID=634784 RepID=A0ABU8BEQ2_9BRAD
MTFVGIALENLRAAKARNLLLAVAFFFAFCLFGVLTAFEQAFNAEATTDAGRLITVNKLSFMQPLPATHFGRLLGISGIGEATFASWFGGYYREPKNSLHAFAVDPATYLEVYRSDILLSESEKTRFKQDRLALLVGEAMAAKWGWRVGDTIPVLSRSIVQKNGSRSWQFTISGIFKGGSAQVDTNFMFLRHDYFNDARAIGQDTIGWIVFRPLPGVDSQSLSNAIDREFLVDPASTATDTERSFNRSFAAQLGNVALMTSLVVGASLVTLLMIVVNTVMISVRERRKDIAELKVLGFSPARIVSIYFAEVLIVATFGGIAGMVAAFGAIKSLGPMLTQIAPGMALSVEVLTIASLLIAVTSLLAVTAPAVFVLRLPALSSLQRS